MSAPTRWQRAAFVLLVAVGVLLRLRAYLGDRSLWLDEAFLTLNILERDFGGLLKPLDRGQAAPVGLLFAQRLMIDLFGSSEYSLRAVPLVMSICSVVAFSWLVTKIVPPVAAIMAVAMFAISDPLVHFAAEAKQYSSDVAVVIGLWSMFTILHRRLADAQWHAWTVVGVLGAAAIWMCHPAIFVVGGVAAYWLWLSRRAKTLVLVCGVTACWLASFAALYFVSLRSVDPSLSVAWRGAVVPIAPVSTRHVMQYYNLVWTLGVLPLGNQVAQLVIFTGIIGTIVLWQCRSRHGAWFAGALVLACLASNLGKYPVAVRLWLFFVPVMVILVAAGVEEMWRRTRTVFPALAPLVAGLILIYPTISAGRGALQPREHEEVRPLLRHIELHGREGDVLYVYREAQYAVQYYEFRGFHFTGETVIGPIGDRYQAERDVEGLRGRRRVWILFSHVVTSYGLDEQSLLVYLLDRSGLQLEAVRRKGATLYLYDLLTPR
jgi:Dolichyl-phosphate-mannose-protein mannosyltransferase